MKQFLFILALLSGFSASSQSLMVGKVPLNQIDTDYIEMQVAQIRPFEQKQYFAIFYGQACMDQPIQMLTRSYLKNCVGLAWSDGELVEGLHYAEALTHLNRAGWELVHISQTHSEGSSSPGSDSVFLLKRKE